LRINQENKEVLNERMIKKTKNGSPPHKGFPYPLRSPYPIVIYSIKSYKAHIHPNLILIIPKFSPGD
jgi:hypothetical protein